jgi:hypothetical protein
LEFLQGLETLVFDSELKHAVRERTSFIASSLRTLGCSANNTICQWTLTEVLKKHVQLQGREVEIDKPVKRLDGSRGIVDLMFSRNIQLAAPMCGSTPLHSRSSKAKAMLLPSSETSAFVMSRRNEKPIRD